MLPLFRRPRGANAVAARLAIARAATLALLGAAAACAGRQPGPDGSASGTNAGAPAGVSARSDAALDDLGAVMLHVDNRGWDDMLIFVVRGNLSSRIGRVAAAGRWSVAMDKWIDPQGSMLQLVAQPMGTRTYGPGAQARSPQLVLKPGQTVLWTIEKDLARSFLEVR